MKFLLLLAALLLMGCERPSPPASLPVEASPTPVPDQIPASPEATPTPTPEELALRIGFLAPLTGVHATYGQDAIRGGELAVEEVNAGGGLLGLPVRLIVRDSHSDAATAVSAARELVNDEDVAVLIGELTTDRTLAVATETTERGLPQITPSATHGSVSHAGTNIFRVCYSDDFQATAMARFARSIDADTAAILFAEDSTYSSDLAAAFTAAFQSLGGKVVTSVPYRTGDKDFGAQLQTIKTATPEIVFAPSYYSEAALIVRQARQAGLDQPMLGTDGWDSPEFLLGGGEALEDCYFSGHFSPLRQRPEVLAFVEKFTQRFGHAPPPLAALAYDATMLAAHAIRLAQSQDAATLCATLAATTGFPGVTGQIDLDASRNPSKDAIIIRIENGKFTYLETSPPPVTTPAPTASP